MKLLDKLKNVFFEEVPEDEDDDELPQTFAKKVEVPKKPVEIIKRSAEALEEEPDEEDEDEDEEEEEVSSIVIPPKVEEKVELPPKEEKEKEFPMMFDDEDFLTDKPVEESPITETHDDYQYLKREVRDNDDNLYQGKKELSYVESVNSRKTTSVTRSYYEDRETKGFKPSPIISPIYGILDKNYHKEEVVTKKETRVVTTSYGKPDLDSVRNKAFGHDEPRKEIARRSQRDEEDTSQDETKKVYDVNNNKPQVNKVTLADADEYYNDLGLAYNVDYSDASRNSDSQKSRYSKEKKRSNKSVDDNLFDLIDSMYNKED